MRIAICLYGSFENLGEKYAYFYRNFIRPNLNAIIEIYIAKTYHQGININYYYTIFGHYLKNVIFVQNQIDSNNPYLYHKIRLLNHKKGLENTHNIKYDAVVLHNLDNIFVTNDVVVSFVRRVYITASSSSVVPSPSPHSIDFFFFPLIIIRNICFISSILPLIRFVSVF